jgi:hypothetical protein
LGSWAGRIEQQRRRKEEMEEKDDFGFYGKKTKFFLFS